METVQTANPPTFESVWAILQEVGEKQKETARQMKETDRRMEETDRILKENAERQKETDRQMKEYNKRFGDFTNRFGEIVEYMVMPNMCDKFNEFGFVFQKATSNTRISDRKNNIFLELDIMLENGEKALMVEIKTKLTIEDVKAHISRIEKMRKYADLHGDKRVFLGAAAGVVIESNVKEYALEQGLYVVEPSGETFNITPPNGKPKEW
jgi:hypothetical protein